MMISCCVCRIRITGVIAGLLLGSLGHSFSNTAVVQAQGLPQGRRSIDSSDGARGSLQETAEFIAREDSHQDLETCVNALRESVQDHNQVIHWQPLSSYLGPNPMLIQVFSGRRTGRLYEFLNEMEPEEAQRAIAGRFRAELTRSAEELSA